MENLGQAQEYKFLFSVIVPVYKTEQYVEETIQSILKQTIGFKKNIQLILVNNASPDDAGKICERYQKKHPQNIVYVNLEENRGPSGGRNAGIPYAQGKYVNFLDSDDKWELDAFEYVADFFEKHSSEIDMVACRMRCFDARNDWDTFDYKFSKSAVCDIFSNPSFMQFNGSSVIFKSKILEEFSYDEEISHTEDWKFNSSIILKNGKYGILREAVFCYRKRKVASSLMQVRDEEKDFYIDTHQKSYLYIINLSKKIYGKTILYVQYCLMQEMFWRIRVSKQPSCLTDEEFLQYKEIIKNIVLEIDDYLILTWPKFWIEYKLTCLNLKYGESVVNKELERRKNKIFFRNLQLCDFDEKSILTIVEQHVSGNNLCFDGKINLPFRKENYEIFAKDNLGNCYFIEEYPGDETNVRLSLGESCLVKRCFRVSVPLQDVADISFYIRWDALEWPLNITFGKFAALTELLVNSYCVDSGYVFRRTDKKIVVEPFSKKTCRQYENAVRKEHFKSGRKKVFLFRKFLPVARFLFGKKKIWLVSDRSMRANDDGEFFFRYLKKNSPKNVKPYFAVSKKSGDYRRMKRYGNVVNIESRLYQVLFALADKILSSTWGYDIQNPYGGNWDFVKDLLHYKFVYLDHALTKDDISADVNKHARNFAMWTTAAQMETDSVLKYPYGYTKEVPKTTGLARYDAVFPAANEAPSKTILFAPTWRKSLVKAWDSNGMAEYNPEFKESEFFNFYNNLINDERILRCMKKNGYNGFLQLHPIVSSQAEDFDCNETICLQKKSKGYVREFFETALVVTDYSSIAMDYGYVGRPAVYAQFDKEEFYKTHSYHESYFDYEQDGFGPVCYDYDETVRAIIAAIEDSCKMEPRYDERRKKFFAYIDDKNCERICKAVLEMDKTENEEAR